MHIAITVMVCLLVYRNFFKSKVVSCTTANDLAFVLGCIESMVVQKKYIFYTKKRIVGAVRGCDIYFKCRSFNLLSPVFCGEVRAFGQLFEISGQLKTPLLPKILCSLWLALAVDYFLNVILSLLLKNHAIYFVPTMFIALSVLMVIIFKLMAEKDEIILIVFIQELAGLPISAKDVI